MRSTKTGRTWLFVGESMIAVVAADATATFRLVPIIRHRGASRQRMFVKGGENMIKLSNILWKKMFLSEEEREKLDSQKAMNKTNTMMLDDSWRMSGGSGGGAGCYSNLPVSPSNPAPRCK